MARPMMDHLSITLNDLARSAPFYDAVMAALGGPCVWRAETAIGYGARDSGEGYLTIAQCPGVVADRRLWAFAARDRAAVRAFHAAGLAAGGQDDGAPSLRQQCHAHYYGAFLRDPDGNRIKAACHREEP